MSGQLSQRVHFAKGLDPVANAFAGTVYTTPVNAKNHARITFLVYKAVGATGTSTFTVVTGTDTSATPVSPLAIPFHYKAITATDVEGAYTAATNTGFTTTAGSSQLYIIEVDCEACGQNNQYVYLKGVEVVASAVLGGVAILLHGGRYQQDIPATALT